MNIDAIFGPDLVVLRYYCAQLGAMCESMEINAATMQKYHDNSVDHAGCVDCGLICGEDSDRITRGAT